MPFSFLSSFPIPLLLLLRASAYDRQTEAGEAAIKDPAIECTPYYNAVVSEHISEFPQVWGTASLVATDRDAREKWESIEPTIPKIAPKPIGMADYPTQDKDCWWTYSKCTRKDDISELPEPRTLGLTYDDGPNCSHNAFYDFLRDQNQKATMFFIGSNVMNWPLEAQRAHADGHEICVHTWSHPYMTSLTNVQVFAELYYSVNSSPSVHRNVDELIYSLKVKAVKTVVGVTPTCWRPPFGDVDDRCRHIARALDLTTVLWKQDTNDWQFGSGSVTKADIDRNYEAIAKKAQNGEFDKAGTIVLCHEINHFTVKEAMDLYPKLVDSFDHIVPVGVGLNITHPYVETEYTQDTFEQYTRETKANLVSVNNTDTKDSTTKGEALKLSAVRALSVTSAILGVVMIFGIFW